jgi:hypothetical protein
MNKGLYVSYNEERNGTFDEAVRISNKLGCVTWLDNFPLNPEQLHYPTDLFVKVKGQERYFRGILLAIASANTLEPDFVDGERNIALLLGEKGIKISGQCFSSVVCERWQSRPKLRIKPLLNIRPTWISRPSERFDDHSLKV